MCRQLGLKKEEDRLAEGSKTKEETQQMIQESASKATDQINAAADGNLICL